MKGRNVEGGIYLLRFSHKTVKCGMGSNIEKRLKQYRGYHRQGKDYPRLLIIKSKYPRELEKILHQTISQKYARIGRLEIFLCRQHHEILQSNGKLKRVDGHQKLVNMIIKKVQNDRRLVHEIIRY